MTKEDLNQMYREYQAVLSKSGTAIYDIREAGYNPK